MNPAILLRIAAAPAMASYCATISSYTPETCRTAKIRFRWFVAVPGRPWTKCPCGWRPDLGPHYATAEHVKLWRELKQKFATQEALDSLRYQLGHARPLGEGANSMTASKDDAIGRQLERLLAEFERLLAELDKLETEIGNLEDQLGLARSSASEPWEERLRRIRHRVESPDTPKEDIDADERARKMGQERAKEREELRELTRRKTLDEMIEGTVRGRDED